MDQRFITERKPTFILCTDKQYAGFIKGIDL
jgi:hypothetical protein